MKTFDLINTPLKGSSLIEASAGTGKTYTIAGLFVRLILEKALCADQVLVVTFTNAATEELKERIRHKLLQTKEGFLRGGSPDPLVGKLVNRSQDPDRAIQMLQDALIDFDKAAIFTIHGFCQKILHENAFETGSLYNTELVTDPSQVVQEIADDYWRKHFCTAPPEFVSYANKKKNVTEPSTFISLLERVRYPDVEILPEIEKPGLEALDNFRHAFKSLQSKWPTARGIVRELLKSPALSGTIYGSLKPDPKSPDITKRDVKVHALIELMDRFVADTGTEFPLFPGFEKFTTAKLKGSVKKNHHPPTHEVFKICDLLNNIGAELEAQMEKYLTFLKVDFFGFAREELSKRKKIKNIQFYDDLLLAVQKALKEGGDRDGDLLTNTIKQRYKAALVDEFQDTDAIQYDIFSTLFGSGDNILFMIGDPKQSIYGFRGADIFSYIKASAKAEAKYTLSENWRSESGLITAVNTIFSNVKAPFLFHDISFIDGKPGNTKVSAPELTGAPFKLWYLPSGGKRPVNKSVAVDSIANAVTAEILKLTSPGADHVQTGDIAVLVRTNRQAQIIKNYLSARHIPAVLYSTGNIFDTDEALEMEQILTSIAEPANHHLFRSALVTDMLGGFGEELDPAEKEPLWWQRRYVQFREYYEIWKNYGFIRMFRTLMTREEIKQRVLTLPSGERRLTNILHLIEVIHRVSIENRLGISALLKWFSEQRGLASTGVEEHQLRLESDERAVKIVTIHKSKGLEYPIVFCPFGWESSVPAGQEIIFHGTNDNKRLTLDLEARKGDYHMALAQNELLAENLRLLYVALTRAKKRCYLIWGRINTAETSALAYVLHDFNWREHSDAGDNIVDLLAEDFLSLADDEIIADLRKLAEKSKGTIEFSLMPSECEGQYESEPLSREKLSCRIFNGRIDKHWKVSSYSSLISKQ
ncbi:MAG: UvrD-helicase domain-containing protein, partial [Deltaproteobacteria bacterium]